MVGKVGGFQEERLSDGAAEAGVLRKGREQMNELLSTGVDIEAIQSVAYIAAFDLLHVLSEECVLKKTVDSLHEILLTANPDRFDD